MRRLLLTLALLPVFHMPAAAQAPRMEEVVRSPADYEGQTLQFTGATLSGSIAKYDVGGVRKYYLTVSSRGRSLEAGFFLAPPRLADRLYDRMSRNRNY